jgi:anti-anti-sigma regulatory factor
MTQTRASVVDCDTLEIQMLRLPEQIDAINLPQVMADLERLLQPGIGVMLDFSRTRTVDRACLKVFEFASQLATERSASLGYMGENAELRALLEVQHYFKQAAVAI